MAKSNAKPNPESGERRTKPRTSSRSSTPSIAPQTGALQATESSTPSTGAAAPTNPKTDKEMRDIRLKLAARPLFNAAGVMLAYDPPRHMERGPRDVLDLCIELNDRANEVIAGDVTRVEKLLLAQADALQSIFIGLAYEAHEQKHIPNLEALLRMALKAQNQSRMTIETLALLKNPTTVFAKQANINNGGQQQINNGVAPPTAPASSNSPNRAPAQNELLKESPHGKRMDRRAARASGSADSQLATVGKVDRAAKR